MAAEGPIETLVRLGLTEYAARTYFALLETGTTTARDASTRGKVPMGKIYRALEELQQHGLVNVLPENPKKYAPNPVEHLITRRQQEFRVEIQQLETKKAELRETFALQGTARPKSGLGDVLVKRGRFNLVQVCLDLLQTSKKDYLNICGPGFLPSWRWYQEAIDLARHRGVRLRFLLPRDQADDPEMKNLAAHVEIRLYPTNPAHAGVNASTLVVDHRRAFLASFLDDASSGARDIGILTDQESLVGSIHATAEALWAASEPYDAPSASTRPSSPARNVR